MGCSAQISVGACAYPLLGRRIMQDHPVSQVFTLRFVYRAEESESGNAVFPKELTLFSANESKRGKEESKQKIYLKIKRCLDVIFSSIGLILFSPMMFVLYLLVLFSSGWPGIYRHQRVGKSGSQIGILKFRTMVKDADKMIDSLSEAQQEEWLQKYRLNDDPRVTKVGRLLRTSKLDELPQLINVLCGELSLVGPRPITEEELVLYGDNKKKLLSIKPGLTGYWQACAGENCSYQERMQMELYYVDHANLLWDVRIVFATVGKVLFHCKRYK